MDYGVPICYAVLVIVRRDQQRSDLESRNLLAEALKDIALALQQEKRVEFGKQLMALGNMAVGALIFGHAFSEFPFDLNVDYVGLLTLVSLYSIAVFIMRGV